MYGMIWLCLFGSFSLSSSQESQEVFGLSGEEFFLFDDPVVVLIEESEDLSEVLRLFFHLLIEDIVFSPLNFAVLIQVVSSKEFSLDFCLVELL